MLDCLTLTCSRTVFIELRTRRNLSFSHDWEHLWHRSWGQHRVALPVITAVSWRFTPLSIQPARAQATAILNERYRSYAPRPSSLELFEPLVASTISRFSNPLPALVLSTLSTEIFCPVFFIHLSTALSQLAPLVILTATLPLATVPVILSGILTAASSVSALSFFRFVSSLARFSSTMRLSSAPVTPISLSQPSFPTTAPLSVQPPVAPELVASGTMHREPVVALLRKRLARRNAKYAELDEVILAREDRVLEL